MRVARLLVAALAGLGVLALIVGPPAALAGVSGGLTLAATATALAANGANCSPGNYPLGVDASGAAESCTAAAGLSGTGATDEAVLRADGVGGATLQNSLFTITDAGVGAGLTQFNLDNLRLDGNTLSATNTNGDVGITTGASGQVNIDAHNLKVSDDGTNFLFQISPQYNYLFLASGSHLAWNNATTLNSLSQDTGLARSAAGAVKVTNGSTGGGFLLTVPHAATCTDSGDGSPGTLTLTPTAMRVHLTNSDAHGCTVTMGETGMVSGMTVEIIVVSNAGVTVDFADSSGVSELAGAFNAAVYDSLTLAYISDRWVELDRSDN